MNSFGASDNTVVSQLVKQSGLENRISDALQDFFANQPEGQALKKEVSLYTQLPYAGAGLVVGLVLGYLLARRR